MTIINKKRYNVRNSVILDNCIIRNSLILEGWKIVKIYNSREIDDLKWFEISQFMTIINEKIFSKFR